MKEKFKNIFAPYRKIKELEEIIEEQDIQYNGVLIKNTRLKRKLEKANEYNEILSEAKDKYLLTIRKLRKEIKELKNGK